jgi:hypothetical protein
MHWRGRPDLRLRLLLRLVVDVVVFLVALVCTLGVRRPRPDVDRSRLVRVRLA